MTALAVRMEPKKFYIDGETPPEIHVTLEVIACRDRDCLIVSGGMLQFSTADGIVMYAVKRWDDEKRALVCELEVDGRKQANEADRVWGSRSEAGKYAARR